MTINQDHDKKVTLYLDSEGIFGHGNSDELDALIFSTTTLLSSHVIYNTLKVIDQVSVDKLDLLAKRSHLFQVNAGGSTNFIAFPHLSFVVRDFHQQFSQTQSDANKWLNSYISGSRSHDQQSIRTLFPSIKAFTLPYPHKDMKVLADLSKIDSASLSPEFRTDFAQLKKYVSEMTPVKTMKQEPIMGPSK